MIALLTIPLIFQAIAMFVDEIYFHRKRGLTRWERIGHPLDTLTVLACFAVALFAPPTMKWLIVFGGFSVFSCLFITKDEPVHKKRCSAGEQWLHSVLFLLHPIVLAAVAFAWVRGFHSLIVVQAALTVVFGTYQICYWNISWIKWTEQSKHNEEA